MGGYSSSPLPENPWKKRLSRHYFVIWVLGKKGVCKDVIRMIIEEFIYAEYNTQVHLHPILQWYKQCIDNTKEFAFSSVSEFKYDIAMAYKHSYEISIIYICKICGRIKHRYAAICFHTGRMHWDSDRCEFFLVSNIKTRFVRGTIKAKRKVLK